MSSEVSFHIAGVADGGRTAFRRTVVSHPVCRRRCRSGAFAGEGISVVPALKGVPLPLSFLSGFFGGGNEGNPGANQREDIAALPCVFHMSIQEQDGVAEGTDRLGRIRDDDLLGMLDITQS